MDFPEAVEQAVRALRPGEVASYGEIAEDAGRPGAARAVGNVLARLPASTAGGPGDSTLPWWRVVQANGRMARGKEEDQARRLRAEGVEVRDGRVRVR